LGGIAKQDLRRLFAAFQEAGEALFLVGGCVRDTLRGVAPKDYDLTTSARPPQIKGILQQAGIRWVPIGEAFGTIAALMEGGCYEITTYRVKESYTKGSRHPVVQFGDDLVEDLARRDLCINAMAMGVQGNVVDPFGGLEDLAARRLRVPGGGLSKSREIVRDDPLRILRVARFVSGLGFTVDEALSEACLQEAAAILEVSRERWKSELERTICGEHAAAALRWLGQTRVLFLCLPELVGLDGVLARQVGFASSGTLFDCSVELLGALPAAPLQRWAALLHGCGIPASLSWEGGLRLGRFRAEEMARRFKFSNEERALLLGLLRSLPQMAALAEAHSEAAQRLALRRLHDELGDALVQLWPLWRALAQARADAAWVERSFQCFLTLQSKGLLAVRLPSGLGALLEERFGLQREDVGRALRLIRERIMEESCPFAAAPEVYLQALEEDPQGQTLLRKR
jgi:tRNA nucleotidyltransferase/poly(A) polymerase